MTNVLVFALWYWHLDAGGPHQRDHASRYIARLVSVSADDHERRHSWRKPGRPAGHRGFMDYLFLAFNTSTALSPADTAVLSRWAKFLMMIQALDLADRDRRSRRPRHQHTN